MTLKTELHRVQRLLRKVERAQRQQQASDLAAETLLVLGAATRALHKDPNDPDDRVHRRVVSTRNLLGRILGKWERTLPQEQLNALYNRYHAEMHEAGLDPSRPNDLLRYAKGETKR